MKLSILAAGMLFLSGAAVAVDPMHPSATRAGAYFVKSSNKHDVRSQNTQPVSK